MAGQHGVEVSDAIVDHERRRPRTEIGGVRGERGPNRLLSSPDGRESPVGLFRFNGHSQVFAIPSGERLGIARFKEYAADPKYLFHANPFPRRRTTKFGDDARLRVSGRPNRGVKLAVLFQPTHLVALGAFLDFAKEFHRFRFVARFTRVIGGNDHLDLHGDNILFGLNESRPLDALAGNSHD